MMNETNGIEVDIDNYYMKEYAKRGWDDVHFANDEDDDGPSSASQVMDENDDADQQDQHNHEGRCTTISTRKKRAAIVLAGIASFGAILGLGYGIGYGIGGSIDSTNSNREAAVLSSNMNAVTLEDCISTYVPTYSPTTYSPSAAPPVVVSASEEEQLVALFFPVFSNDIPIITDDDEVVTTTKTSEEEDEGDSNANANGPVRTRRRLGSPLPTMTLEQPLMSREVAAEQQRVSNV